MYSKGTKIAFSYFKSSSLILCSPVFFFRASCCHQCQSQSESDQNYLASVAELFKNGSASLLSDFQIQVRFEFGHRSGALLELPAINIRVSESHGCTIRNTTTQ